MSFDRCKLFQGTRINELSISSERSASRPAVTRIKAGTMIDKLIIDGEEVLSPVIGLIGDTYFEAGVIFKNTLLAYQNKSDQILPTVKLRYI